MVIADSDDLLTGFVILVILILVLLGFSSKRMRLMGFNSRTYPILGVMLLFFFSAAEYWGWGYVDSDKIRNVPKTVRQNPGVYRSHYRSYGRTFGGK
jgi:hypothetical protein